MSNHGRPSEFGPCPPSVHHRLLYGNQRWGIVTAVTRAERVRSMVPDPPTVPKFKIEGPVKKIEKRGKNTEFPTSLNESDFGVVDEKGNGPPEKIGFGLEVGVEDGNVIALFNVAVFHSFLESSCFVPVPVVSYLVLDVYAFARPSLAFEFHHVLQFLF